MLKVDEAIFDTNKAICRNISVFDASERGLLAETNCLFYGKPTAKSTCSQF